MIVKIFKKEGGYFISNLDELSNELDEIEVNIEVINKEYKKQLIDVVATYYEEKRKDEIISTIDDTLIDKFIQKYNLSTSEEEFWDKLK